ncbi:helix-turn-helix transcriptional regulator [Actinomycetospora flava]|uniref:Helix-turn-helix transcriptional regulator n=1 Tax=Actinomycetospora flava TaxID=3129232 RepID=A0ABU8M9I8_9PSEU
MQIAAERARLEIRSLATAGLDMPTFSHAALDVLTRAVPFSVACLAPADPATNLITGNVKWGGVGDEYDEQWIYHEYEGPDPFNFQVVAGRPGGVATAMVETGGDLRSSPRFTDLYHHWDVGDEARMALQSDGASWGFLALFRDGARSAFTDAEQEYLSGVRTALAVGLRAGTIASAGTELLPAAQGPVVLVVDGADEIVRLSVGAADGLAHLTGEPIGRGPLPFSVRALVGAARRFARGQHPTVPRMRLRSRTGRWLVGHASPLLAPDGGAAEVVVTLEEARPPEIVPLVIAALGLTGRERDVVALTLQGVRTADMARTLELSSYTVQDHLKSIFEKAGVRSRRELLATVFYDQYAPRLEAGAGLGPSGWFTT